MEEVCGFHKKPLNTAIGRALTPIASIGHTQRRLFLWFHREKVLSWHVGP
jgi:hypothetical protein